MMLSNIQHQIPPMSSTLHIKNLYSPISFYITLKPHNLFTTQAMLFIINQHLNLTLTQMIHLTTNHPFVLPLMLLLMMSMHNPKTIIPTSLPTLYMLLIQQKHHPLMKHLFHPYHVFMITQAQTCLHHQEYHHHILQLHMPFLCCMFKPSPKTIIMLHHHHLPPNT